MAFWKPWDERVINFQPAVSAMARRRLGVLWLSLLSLPGLGFFDFFAKPEEEDAPKGKVATATRRIREVDES